ncbi:MAG: GatB/YqeY domain-containing protein [Dehalococcoidia bacterium]|nr:GatB/YqeY domain-containing protein [Dehalococcoidia bacterium]
MTTRLEEKLRDDLKSSLRSGDKNRLATIRLIISAITYFEKSRQQPVNEQDIIGVIAREGKQRRESIEAYTQGNRQDLVDKEKAELAVIMEYLPEQMERVEVEALAKKVIDEVGAKTLQDKGKVMSKLMPQLKGKVDGQIVNSVVSELLQG